MDNNEVKIMNPVASAIGMVVGVTIVIITLSVFFWAAGSGNIVARKYTKACGSAGVAQVANTSWWEAAPSLIVCRDGRVVHPS